MWDCVEAIIVKMVTTPSANRSLLDNKSLLNMLKKKMV